MVAKLQAETFNGNRVSQGSVFKNIEYIEYATQKNGIVEVSKIDFPLVVVLTQDCDLAQDPTYKKENEIQVINDDKRLFSVLVAPLYNAEHVYEGKHLSNLRLDMQKINSDRKKVLKNNQTPRYHYIEFPNEFGIVPQIIDFKHYFSISLFTLENIKSTNLKCHISKLFREDISHRFASYLSRIALPD